MKITGFFNNKIVVQLSPIHYPLSTEEIGRRSLFRFLQWIVDSFKWVVSETDAVAQLTVDARVEELDVFESIGIAAT